MSSGPPDSTPRGARPATTTTAATTDTAGGASTTASSPGPTTKSRGDVAEDRALAHLQAAGLVLLQRNYRLAGGPHVRGAEIDLILRERDGTLVFAEVRSRHGGGHGGAAASVSAAKQRRIVRAAQHYLMRLSTLPPCRFDVVALEGTTLQWFKGAFDAR